MANFHNIFLRYNEAISLSKSRVVRLRSARKAIESTIRREFKVNKNLEIPRFWIQGSVKMETLILKKDNTYDVDLGIYFVNTKGFTAKTLQDNVVRAVKKHPKIEVQHKEKCIRVVYKGDFNIDLPVYHFPNESKTPLLATKSGYEASDPKELVDWFKKGETDQLKRIAKYLKAWTDNYPRKMPSGICLSVWAKKYYVKSTRDDIALLKTLENIKGNWSIFRIKCINPAEPKDDLVSKLNEEQRIRFKKLTKELINDLEVAINTKDSQVGFDLLSKHFGKRFPLKHKIKFK